MGGESESSGVPEAKLVLVVKSVEEGSLSTKLTWHYDKSYDVIINCEFGRLEVVALLDFLKLEKSLNQRMDSIVTHEHRLL